MYIYIYIYNVTHGNTHTHTHTHTSGYVVYQRQESKLRYTQVCVVRTTASSRLMLLLSSFPPKYSDSMVWILGILVDPPTRMIWSTSPLDIPASFRTCVT